MSQKILFVSGADARYMPLLEELIASIQNVLSTQDKLDFEPSFGVINAGLEQSQIEQLKSQNIEVADGIWPTEEAKKRAGVKQFLKACVSRPFIPELFPDYDLYIWLDADTWVQDFFAVDWLIKGANKKGLAATPQVDRNWGKSMRVTWFGRFPFKARSFYYSNARAAFGHKTARQLFPFPTVNVGVFAMTAESPQWARWQELIKQALKKGKIFTAEQLTMGMMIWLEKCDVEFLPATCNWLCENKPLWDAQIQKFVEPSTPYHPIGIMHLSGYDEMRLNPSITCDVSTVDDKKASMSLRYLDSHAAENKLAV
jgi:lipopolysaccharide biosynthesis glycosyltransferase